MFVVWICVAPKFVYLVHNFSFYFIANTEYFGEILLCYVHYIIKTILIKINIFIYKNNICLHKVTYMFRPLGLNKWRGRQLNVKADYVGKPQLNLFICHLTALLLLKIV